MSVSRADRLGGRAAIVGIGATEFSKDSGRSELTLAVEAVRVALDDAGLTPADVDGLVTFTMDTSPEITVAQASGMGELSFFSRIHYGGGAACATVQQAALAVASGVAEVVVCYRAFNERSGRRFGSGVQHREPSAEGAALGWSLPFGLLTPASWVAMSAQRYLHTHGLTPEAFGRVAVVDRKYAATNPAAYFHGKPITLEDHAASRWIVEPLRLLDCCQETDGGQAVVVTSVERARDLRRSPAVIAAAAQGAGRGQEQMTSFYRDDLTGLPEMGVVARQLWRTSGLGPTDMDVGILYDHFTPFVLMQLEEFGFCKPGEAADFVAQEALPINTHGGQLGEAYLHGMNGIAEGVRQIRGAAVNQIPEASWVLVTAGTGVPTSGLILGSDG
ncbi:lipid-transfer protein [Streptomyces sp. YIM 130001]|uniref:lipid-transfer protein n=1 Tax=Streptomyces sp. YIM 130001 TaxID=2259644 RepID=UPI000E647F35|nr:lipid-transfer protein [Streptomyces sp. YIM 130001]RII11936.1 lipid-transfer protein [Streptomyces sp. YIM 130001]